jgi:4-amino-4-deoxy-L-arabinose transferase-like glycosyltransferase
MQTLFSGKMSAQTVENKKPFLNKISVVLLIAILAVSAGLMLNVSSQESAIMDELAHIPAGYSYDRYLDYRLNPEHPPLVKALAAVPLLLLNLNFPLQDKSWQTEINGQWDAGSQFLYKVNDGKADEILFLARIFPIILTLLLILFVYWWSRRLMGPLWALLPTLFTGLSPNILAHGHYVTTDIGAALGFFIALFAYSSYLDSPSKKMLWISGVAFGISQILKFSTVLLVPFFIIFMLVHWWLKSREGQNNIFSKDSLKILWKHLVSLVLIFFIGYVMVWMIYGLFTINYPIQRQQSDTTNILVSFGGGPDPTWQKCPPHGIGMRCLADIDIWMSSSPIFRSIGYYLLGILMVIQRSAGGNTAYFLGQIGGAGWWYYFPVIYLLKETLPALILIGIGLILALKRFSVHIRERRKNIISSYLSLNFGLFMMLVTVVFYWLYSMHSTLNIGFRHILPTIPFLYILSSVSLKKWFNNDNMYGQQFWYARISLALKNLLSHSLKTIVILFLALWLVVEVIIAYPYFLSYFNEVGGGVWGGYKNVTDSNYDWGQDLKRLKTYVEENHIDKIAVDYFGGGDINYYLGDKAVPWWSSKGNPLDQGINWIAISANTIESAKAVPDKYYVVNPADTYPWLTIGPYARAGTSIFIYRLQ